MAIDWGVIASIMAILGGFSAFLLWLVRMVIKQMLTDFRNNTVDATANGIKDWARGEFPSKVEFAAHYQKNLANQSELTRVIAGLVGDQAADHKRVRDLEKLADQLAFRMDAHFDDKDSK